MILGLFLVFVACQKELPSSSKSIAPSASTVAPHQSPSTASPTVIIYDRQATGKGAYRAVTIPQKQKDAVRDAIAVFLTQSQWPGQFQNIQLQRIGMINRQANFAFAGTAGFKDTSEQQQFLAALDSTIAYHYHMPYTVYLNGKTWKAR